MTKLEFWPGKDNDRLVVGDGEDGVLEPGDTFEASEEDVERLLENPDIRRPGEEPEAAITPQERRQQENAAAQLGAPEPAPQEPSQEGSEQQKTEEQSSTTPHSRSGGTAKRGGPSGSSDQTGEGDS